MFDKHPRTKAYSTIEENVHVLEKKISLEDQQLREMFYSLKTDLLDEFLSTRAAHLKEEHVRILKEQVRHVLSIAHCIGSGELIDSFSAEEHVLEEIEDIVHQFPQVNVSSSPDLRGALERLRSSLIHQQQMIFSHEGILTAEKKRLVDILKQVHELRSQDSAPWELSADKNTTQYS